MCFSAVLQMFDADYKALFAEHTFRRGVYLLFVRRDECLCFP